MARPRGYADWNANPESLAVIDQVQEVLRDYSAHLPLTARQIFYRMVGAYNYPKTEKDYNNLANKLVLARRAQMIPFSSIRDDGTAEEGGGGWSGVEGFWRSIHSAAEYYERDRMAPQEVAIELWCEAAGMAPQLARATEEYSIPVYSTGGFSSVTVTHEIAQRARGRGDKPTLFLHVGDYDPSGESIFTAMAEDALAFCAYDEELFRPERVALTREQVDEHGLPTAPPKRSDSRSASWFDETCQAEAMPPDLLAQTVREAVEAHLDLDLHEQILEEEEAERKQIIDHLDDFEVDREEDD